MKTIKNYLILLFIPMCLGLGAGSKDDASSGEFSEGGSFLIGTWTEDYNDSEYDVTASWRFNEDGSGTLKRVYYYEDTSRVADRDYYSFEYRYDKDSKKLTIIVRSETDSNYSFTYNFKVRQITNDKIRLDYSDGRGQYGTLYRDK